MLTEGGEHACDRARVELPLIPASLIDQPEERARESAGIGLNEREVDVLPSREGQLQHVGKSTPSGSVNPAVTVSEDENI